MAATNQPLVYDTRFELRISEKELQRWRLVCGPLGLSRWLRDVANREALKFHPEQAVLPPRKVRSCTRWMYHREGVYCPACDRMIRQEEEG